MSDKDIEMEEDMYNLPTDREEEFPPEKSPLTASEPLFVSLLRNEVAKLWPGDETMQDFVDDVAAPVSDWFITLGAKGGDFVLQRREKGQKVEEHYVYDQSMRAHVINGLLPVLHVARKLEEWKAPQLRAYDDATRRVFMAGYILHDYLKLPQADQKLRAAGFSHDHSIGPEQMPTLEEIFVDLCSQMGLVDFLAPVGGVHHYLHDIVYVSCNTQVRWGTLRNLSLLKRLALSPVQLDLAEQLSRLADLLAYVARTPQSVGTDSKIHEVLTELSNGIARFSYHHLADNRGVLSNFIQNAALEAMSGPYRIPLLYAPSGVVYLEHKEESPPQPDPEVIASATIQQIKEVVGRALARSRNGMKRDGKGMKYASYYWLFFDLPFFIQLGAQATFDIIREGKNPSAGKRFAKMIEGNWMSPEVDLDLPDDLRVDQLAEWCYLAEKQVAEQLPDFDTAAFLLKAFNLEDLQIEFASVPRDNRAGGVGYHWYFAAGHYLKRHPGLDPTAWRERIEAVARQLSDALLTAPASAASPTSSAKDWNDLREYILRTVTLSRTAKEENSRDSFTTELRRYSSAKRKGKGNAKVCSLCSSAYRVDKQQEAAVLFAPQVYSNKKSLHSSDPIRDICSICSMEMMLRQILMNRSAASGGNFEGRRMRYLYFYPTYFFTPETLSILRRAYAAIHHINIKDLKRELVDRSGNVDFSAETLQRLGPLLLTPEDEIDVDSDRFLRLHFPETDPITFFFMGVPPPGRDAKDAEAWVHPALLALLLPLCLDVKVVASESPIPVMLEADEITETVFLDSPHAAISYITDGLVRVNINQILPSLQRVLAGYFIHVDANSKAGPTGFDFRWQDLPVVARAISETPLYVFHYLKKWQRRFADSIHPIKAHQYLAYVSYLQGEKDMSHARQLTMMYRQFYRALRNNSNSILRPVSIAARTVLDADPRIFTDQESLVEAVYGELRSFSERAYTANLAYFPKGSDWRTREKAMQEFAAYFVCEIFYKALRGDKSALRGKQINLLKNACEVIYVVEAARERAETAGSPEPTN